MSLEERVMDLESRLAFQDDAIEAMNDVLVTQQRVVERLQLQMAALLKAGDDQLSASARKVKKEVAKKLAEKAA